MAHKTPLFDTHVAQGAKMVDFGGWQMPMNYGSQIEEHHQVRRHAGMFDVSHMTIVDITGKDAKVYLQHLLANDVAKIADVQGKALYSGMLNENGGVIDDLIVYAMGDWFRTVVNCSTREKDLAWMEKQAAEFDVALTERPELAMVAVQGPKAIEVAASVVSEAKQTAMNGLKVFVGAEVEGWFIARTGYTGEDGLEIMLPAEEAAAFWVALTEAGVAPCGLGARDTLRLEAGMNLYGNDMDDSVSPLAANMGWTIAWEPSERDFVGRKALEQQKAEGTTEKLAGLVMRSKGVLRAGQKIAIEEGAEVSGVITSGTFSPSLECSIAMARVPKSIGTECWVEMRGKRVKVDVVKPAFVRNGKSLID